MTTHLVDVPDRNMKFGGSPSDEGFALSVFIEVIRRSINRDDYFCPEIDEVNMWAVIYPDVFTNRHSNGNTVNTDEFKWFNSGSEIPLFVEHAVIRQAALPVDVLDLPVGTDRCGIAQVFLVAVDKSDDGYAIARYRSKVVKGSELIINESGFEEEILGWIASDAEFAECDDRALPILGILVRRFELFKVRADRSHRGVELGEREPEVHSAKANDRPGELSQLCVQSALRQAGCFQRLAHAAYPNDLDAVDRLG